MAGSFSIRSTNDMTSEWLTQILHDNGVLDGGRVISINRKPCNHIATASTIFRIYPKYELACSGPETLILKMACLNKADGGFHTSNGFYSREVMFYKTLPRAMSDKVPRFYNGEWDGESIFHLLLEDSHNKRRQPTADIGMKLEEAYLVMDWLAEFHSYWWNSDVIEQSKHYLQPPRQITDKAKALKDFEYLWNKIGDWFSDGEKRLCIKIIDEWDSLAKLQSESPKTLCHGDFHHMNFFLPENPLKETVHIIDWQFCHWGIGVSDLADYLGFYVHPQYRRQFGWKLVSRYWNKLIEHGVSNYGLEDLYNDFKVELTKNLLIPLFQINIPNLSLSVVINCLRNAIIAYEDVMGMVEK